MTRSRYDDGYLTGYATWDPASLTASPCDVTETTITVNGAKVGDFAIASFSNDVNDTMLDAQVTAANTVSITLSNVADVTRDLASGTLRAIVFPL